MWFLNAPSGWEVFGLSSNFLSFEFAACMAVAMFSSKDIPSQAIVTKLCQLLYFEGWLLGF